MSVSSNEVKFYTGRDCIGTPVSYKAGDSIAFLSNEIDSHDKYLSCIVGSKVFVNAYQYKDAFNSEVGQHDFLVSGRHRDLSYMNGISKLQVISSEFGFAIDVKLTDKTIHKLASNGGYELTITSNHQAEPLKCLSGDAYRSCPIHRQTKPDSEIVCHITVASTQSGVIVANGSISFKLNITTGIISFTKTNGFPATMSVVQEDKTSFNFNYYE
eukprot:gene12188-14263_t